MENKQTAVEWIIEQMWAPCRTIPSHIIEQAKQMEKEQIINAHIEGQPFATTISAKAEQYYNETYNK